MINRKALTSDIPATKSLWKDIFGDLNDYTGRFIEHFGVENCYVCEVKHEIVAMAFAIPTTLASFNVQCSMFNVQNLKYIYACATHQDFQSQGIMRNLLHTIYEDACHENIIGIFLQAANDSLTNYYKNLGFEDFFFRDHSFYYNHKDHEECTKTTKSNKKFNFISPETYLQKRVQRLKNRCFVNWDKGFFNFINKDGISFCEYEETIFSFKKKVNTIIVDELLGEVPFEQIAHILFEHLPEFQTVHIRSEGNTFCCGQIKWCNLNRENLNRGWFAFELL